MGVVDPDLSAACLASLTGKRFVPSKGFTFRGFPNTGSYTQNIQFDGLQGPTLKKAATSAVNVDSMEFLKGPNGVLYFADRGNVRIRAICP